MNETSVRGLVSVGIHVQMRALERAFSLESCLDRVHADLVGPLPVVRLLRRLLRPIASPNADRTATGIKHCCSSTRHHKHGHRCWRRASPQALTSGIAVRQTIQFPTPASHHRLPIIAFASMRVGSDGVENSRAACASRGARHPWLGRKRPGLSSNGPCTPALRTHESRAGGPRRRGEGAGVDKVCADACGNQRDKDIGDQDS